jgi:photoactive yellow protein
LIQPLTSPPPDSTLRPIRFDQLSDDELDILPHGVIALDREGRVRRYNLAEARFARLDRAHVVGQEFFARIALCTATPEFEGQVQGLFQGRLEGVARFDYIFDFRFGAQEVAIEAERLGEHVYLTVRRKRLLPPRTPGVARAPGVAQRDLAPDEPQAGVLRDGAGQRVIHLGPPFFEGLLQASARAGVPHDLLEECGAAWGRLSVVELEADALERFESVLRDLPMVTAAEFVSDYVRQRGWGRLSFDFAHTNKGAVVLVLERSPFAEVGGRPRGKTCDVMAGFLRSVMSHLAHKKLSVREVRCASEGGERCELVVVGEARRPLIDAALAGGASTTAEVLDVSRRAARGDR